MKQIDVISIPVSNQQRSKKFYTKLGFETIAEQDMDKDQSWLQMRLPGGGPSVTLVTWFKKMPAGSLQGLVIRTDDIVEEVRNLRSNGIVVTQIEETPWGKFASLKDPDGNGLSLQQRL